MLPKEEVSGNSRRLTIIGLFMVEQHRVKALAGMMLLILLHCDRRVSGSNARCWPAMRRVCRGHFRQVLSCSQHFPQGLKPADFAGFMARLKPVPFKTWANAARSINRRKLGLFRTSTCPELA